MNGFAETAWPIALASREKTSMKKKAFRTEALALRAWLHGRARTVPLAAVNFLKLLERITPEAKQARIAKTSAASNFGPAIRLVSPRPQMRLKHELLSVPEVGVLMIDPKRVTAAEMAHVHLRASAVRSVVSLLPAWPAKPTPPALRLT